MTLAGDQPLGFTSVRVSAEHDPDVNHKAESLSVSRPVVTARLPEPAGARHPSYLFTFEDIGAVGVDRWLALNEPPFHSALDALRGVFRPHDAYLESKVGMAAIAVEKIGHELGVERGMWAPGRRGKENPTFRNRCLELVEVVGPGVVPDAWPADLTRVNRALKHPEWPEVDGDEVMACWLNTRRALRAWVAIRLGMDRTTMIHRLGPIRD